MEWLGLALAFIKNYKTIIIYGTVALMVGGGLIWVHHDGYEKGIAKVNEVKKELAQEKAIHAHDVAAYKDAQDAVKDFNDKKVARLDAIIDRNNKDYNVKLKRMADQAAKRQASTPAAFHPTDTVVAPVNFRLLYNSAVSGYTGFKGPEATQEDRFQLTDKVDTFGASPFTEVLTRNVDKYNALALKCDKLIDIVNEQESDSP